MGVWVGINIHRGTQTDREERRQLGVSRHSRHDTTHESLRVRAECVHTCVCTQHAARLAVHTIEPCSGSSPSSPSSSPLPERS